VKLPAQSPDLASAAQSRRIEERAFAVHVPGLHRVAKTLPIQIAKIRRYDEIELPADGISRLMAEQRRRSGTPKLNDAAGIGYDDRVLIHPELARRLETVSLR